MPERFYTLGATFAKKWFWGQIVREDIELVEKWVGIGMRGFKNTIHINIVEGTEPGNFLWVGFPLIIVSTNVLEVWEKYEKFETYSVVIGKTPSPVKYTGVIFLGRGGPFDHKKSKAVYSKNLDSMGRPALLKQEGMYFDVNQWDRSDLFTIDEFPCVPVVTERAIKAMKEAKLTNCKYVSLEEYGIYK
jgi:hypothetical protein